MKKILITLTILAMAGQHAAGELSPHPGAKAEIQDNGAPARGGEQPPGVSRAINLYRQGHYPEAVSLLRPVIASDPDNYNACFYLALSLLKTTVERKKTDGETAIAIDNLTQSERLFGKCLKIYPDSGASWNNLGVVYHALWENTGDAEYGKKAEQCFIRSRELNSSITAPVYNQSLTKIGKGEYTQAYSLFNQAINLKLEKKYAGIGYYYFGEKNYSDNDFRSAVERLTKTYEAGINPGSGKLNKYLADSYFHLGADYYLKQDYSRAISSFERSSFFLQGRKRPEMLFMLADSYLWRNRTDSVSDCERAIRHFDQAEREGYGRKWLYFNRGVAYAKTKQYKRAFDDFTRFGNNGPLVQFWMGYIYDATARNSEAIRHYSRAISLDPGMKEAYLNRALCLRRAGDYAQCNSDLARARSFYPASSAKRAMIDSLIRFNRTYQ